MAMTRDMRSVCRSGGMNIDSRARMVKRHVRDFLTRAVVAREIVRHERRIGQVSRETQGTYMRRLGIWMLVAGLGSGLAACGGDGTGPTIEIPADLVGTWAASPACAPTCGFTFENAEDPADSTNFTALGVTSRFTLNAAGGFTFSAGVPTTVPIGGRMRVEGGSLVVEATGEFEEERIAFTRSADLLGLTWQETYAFDLDDDGIAESVTVRGQFERQ